MLTAAQLLECSLNAKLTSNITLPVGWTEVDAKTIGMPVVIGNRELGYLGVIECDSRQLFAWHGDETRATHSEAQADVITAADRLKRELSRMGHDDDNTGELRR